MNKKVLLLVIVTFLFLPKLALADLAVSLLDFYFVLIPLIVMIVVLEAYAFRLLAERLLDSFGFSFRRVILATFAANIVTYLLGIPFRSVSELEYVRYEIHYNWVFLVALLSLAYIVSVFVEWGIYIPFFRKSTTKFGLLKISLFVNVTSYVLLGSFIMSVPYRLTRVDNNLSSIQTCQEAYRAENGVYLECKPSPPNGGTDAKPDRWVDAGGFDEVGFWTEDRVRYQYAVTVSDDGESYTATAVGDVDEDGIKVTYTVTNSSRMVKHPLDEF